MLLHKVDQFKLCRMRNDDGKYLILQIRCNALSQQASLFWAKGQFVGILQPNKGFRNTPDQVKSNPSAGHRLDIAMNDPRWPASEGWVKMQQIVPTSQGNINIHYVYNQTLKIFDDFKFK